MKLKTYSLYYSWYEEHVEYEFTHPQNKFKAEFEQDCQDLLLKYTRDFVVNNNLSSNCSWIGTNTLIHLVSTKLPELGYVPLSDTFEKISFGVFGSNILQDEDREEEIFKLLGEELSNLVIEKNNELEKQMNVRYENINP